MKRNIITIGLTSFLLVACTADQLNSGVNIGSNLFKGMTVSNEQLATESKLTAKEMDSKAKLASNKSKYTIRLNKLTKNLRYYDGLNLNYKVHLSDKYNAYALPDGTVRINSKLMDEMTDDEIISVLGHEIGHVAKKHSLAKFKRSYLAKAAKQGLGSIGGTVGALAGSYGDIGEAYVNSRFSQAHELESDNYGVGVLHKLGRNPYAASSAQEKFLKLGGGGGIFSSHPPTQKRIDLARQAADKITGKK